MTFRRWTASPAWLGEHQPADAGGCLIHNDYKYDNLVLDPQDVSQINAVLDWEMATIGDPLMDLGSTLGYWVDADDPADWQQQSFGLTTRPGNLNREQLVERYVAQSGRPVKQRRVLLCLRVVQNRRHRATDLRPLQTRADPGRTVRGL